MRASLDNFHALKDLWSRDLHRFFDQVGHQTTYASIGAMGALAPTILREKVSLSNCRKKY